MKSLQVTNGDLVIGVNNQAKTVQGQAKLVQDLTLWIEEPLGTGYTTPNFGSQLFQFIGTPNPTQSSGQIQSEVQRILGLYQVTQKNTLLQSQSRGQLSNWNKSEVINQVLSINSSVSQTQVQVDVQIQTLAATSTSLQLFVSGAGITSVTGGSSG